MYVLTQDKKAIIEFEGAFVRDDVKLDSEGKETEEKVYQVVGFYKQGTILLGEYATEKDRDELFTEIVENLELFEIL